MRLHDPLGVRPILRCSRRGRPRLVWGRGPGLRGGWRRRALQAALGARPTSRGTRLHQILAASGGQKACGVTGPVQALNHWECFCRFDLLFRPHHIRLSQALRSRFSLYRPQIGPPARNGKKWLKNGFWPHHEKRGTMAEQFLGHFLNLNFPFVHGGAKIHFSAIFSHFGPQARFGVCTGELGSQRKGQARSQTRQSRVC